MDPCTRLDLAAPKTVHHYGVREFAAIFKILLILLFLHPVSAAYGEGDFDIQPIQFSHKTHAGSYEISCDFCHGYTKRSPKAGIPTQNSCLSCHQIIKGTTDEQQTEIKKLETAWFLSDPVKWKRIYDLPDFVYFSHRSHQSAGVECQNCHGDVEQLEEIRLSELPNDLSMGWCMECHQKPFDTKKKRSVTSEDTDLKSQPDQFRFPKTDCLSCHQ